jgi:hypothetical protein
MYLEEISPSDKSGGSTQNVPLVFTVASDAGNVSILNTKVWVNGNLALDGITFQPGYDGTITGITGTYTKYKILMDVHPLFPAFNNVVTVYTEDSSPDTGWLSFSFGCDVTVIKNLRAKSFCEGKRIDLSFEVPENVEQISIKRSKFAFSTFFEDPAVTLYEGPPTSLDASAMSGYVDGIFSDPVIRSSNTALEENTFYYYTIFVSYGEVNAAQAWITDEGAQAEGLSIKSYPVDWLYALLPSHYRKTDADEKRGSDQYKLRDYCRVLQCGLNLQRGWIEALLKLRDPESMPAGRLEDNENQKCILSAQSASLGLAPERTFDAGVLRSVVSGITSVYKNKGTCPGLVSFVKLFTQWDSRCDEANEPLCGVNRLFKLWDIESYIRKATCSVPAEIDISTAGQVTFSPSLITLVNGNPTPLTVTKDEPFKFIIDALGTFYCIDSISEVDPLVFYFADPSTLVRAEIGAPGVLLSPGQFQIGETYAPTLYGGWPWQFPSEAPKFAINALKGLKLLDSSNTLHEIVSSEETSGSNTTLTLATDPADGDVFIAYDYTLGAAQVDRVPIWQAKLYAGEFSLIYSPTWDPRHFAEESIPGPFSVYAGFGSPGATGSSTTPSDVTLWIANQHEYLSRVTGITPNELVDSEAAWTDNQWFGYYVLPSWEQTQLFQVVGNTSDTIIVAGSGSKNFLKSTSIGQEYVILTAKNAYKYEQLCKALPSFAPVNARVLVKFEETI